MIHSLSGGVIREKKYFDFAKVRFDNGEIYWYVSTFDDLKAGDRVLVPVGRDDKEMEAFVIRVDRHVSEQVSPIPAKRAKRIIKILNR